MSKVEGNNHVNDIKEKMLSWGAIKELEHQGYRMVGEHSAVKICGWTRNMLNNNGGCYKLKFYGIMSHQCMQMTTSISCANRCVFCWRGYKAPVNKEWIWGVDEPTFILNKSVEAHHKLLAGFGGSHKVNIELLKQSKEVKHVALSLTGEPIIYPKINELIDLFHRQGVSTFLVTNAQYPEEMKNLHRVTQLYLSVDAPTKELLKEVDKPLFKDYWERMQKCLEILALRKERTCVRLTVLKGINDNYIKEYIKLLNIGKPDFIEIKAYMFIGQSRERLKEENMPLHEEIVEFAKRLVVYLFDYEIVTEHVPSRVVMLAKKKLKHKDGWHTWIDFGKFHTLINSGAEFRGEDYLRKTPLVGLSGKGTKDYMSERWNKKLKEKNRNIIVDEKTEELSFYTQ
ncbi:4-demethylwyosine synthase TYW1 [Candidatus Woesearchaeota archaeon]|nr:4-demethylwyosine synthase TYW1 [Candidatus Woesearchaeota archaeon]